MTEKRKQYEKKYRQLDKRKQYLKEYNKKYREQHKEYFKEYNKKYHEEHKEERNKYALSKYYENKEKRSESWKEYYKEHRTELSIKNYEYKKQKRKNDPIYKLNCSVRSMINDVFNKRIGYKKKLHTEEILGCTIEEFIKYIQSKFKEGMTLENHGEWHLDHIIPVSSAKTEEELIKLNHYTNLQPLWAEENLKKWKKIL